MRLGHVAYAFDVLPESRGTGLLQGYLRQRERQHLHQLLGPSQGLQLAFSQQGQLES